MSHLPISQQVFQSVVARSVMAGTSEHSALVHIFWRAPGQGARVVQIYVNDELAEITSNINVREAWLVLDRYQFYRVELLAVALDDLSAVFTSHRDDLKNWTPAVHNILGLAVGRDRRLPIRTHLRVDVDQVQVSESPLWPRNVHRSGFGALFGLGEFGYDNAAGLGLGGGELGQGPLGQDEKAWRLNLGRLSGGSHAVDVRAVDISGQLVAQSAMLNTTLEMLPGRVKNLTVDSGFQLQWTK